MALIKYKPVDMNSPAPTHKVFFCSANKTGTNTYTQILKANGVSARHTPRWPKWIMTGKYRHIRDGQRAWLDGPVPELPSLPHTLIKLFPDCRFVYQTRDLRGWMISRHFHVEVNKALNKSTWDNTEKDMARWIYHRSRLDLLMDIFVAEGRAFRSTLFAPEAFWKRNVIQPLERATGVQMRNSLVKTAWNTADDRIAMLKERYKRVPDKEASADAVDHFLHEIFPDSDVDAVALMHGAVPYCPYRMSEILGEKLEPTQTHASA